MSGYEIFLRVLNMSMTASVIIIVVLLSRLILRNAPKLYSYVLWSVVLFRLLFPFSLSAPVSVLGLFDTPVVNQQISNEGAIDKNLNSPTSYVEYIPSDIVYREIARMDLSTEPQKVVNQGINNNHNTTKAEETTIDYIELLVTFATYAWLIGILVMIGKGLIAYIKLRKSLVGAVLYDKNIYIADYIPTPFVMGLIYPKIYLPSELEKKDYEYVICHEKCHIRRGDIVFKLLAYIALSIHWFNPLVWVAFYMFVKDMELSCDEAVLKKLGESIRADYASSILEFASGKKMLFGTMLAFGESEPAGRIKNLSKWKRPARIVTMVAGMLCVIIVVGCIFNPAKNDNSQTTSQNVENQEYRVSFYGENEYFVVSSGEIQKSNQGDEIYAGDLEILQPELFKGIKKCVISYTTYSNGGENIIYSVTRSGDKVELQGGLGETRGNSLNLPELLELKNNLTLRIKLVDNNEVETEYTLKMTVEEKVEEKETQEKVTDYLNNTDDIDFADDIASEDNSCTVSGSFTVTVTEVISDAASPLPTVAVVSQFQSYPFTMYVGEEIGARLNDMLIESSNKGEPCICVFTIKDLEVEKSKQEVAAMELSTMVWELPIEIVDCRYATEYEMGLDSLSLRVNKYNLGLLPQLSIDLELDNTMPYPTQVTGADYFSDYYNQFKHKFHNLPAGIVNGDALGEWVMDNSNMNIPHSRIGNSVNLYTFIKTFNIPYDKLYDYYINQLASVNGLLPKDEVITKEELDILYSDNEVEIVKCFASDYSIVIGDNIYSPQWVYLHTPKDYANVGITKEMLLEKLEKYKEMPFTKEALDTLETKINRL